MRREQAGSDQRKSLSRKGNFRCQKAQSNLAMNRSTDGNLSNLGGVARRRLSLPCRKASHGLLRDEVQGGPRAILQRPVRCCAVWAGLRFAGPCRSARRFPQYSVRNIRVGAGGKARLLLLPLLHRSYGHGPARAFPLRTRQIRPTCPVPEALWHGLHPTSLAEFGALLCAIPPM